MNNRKGLYIDAEGVIIWYLHEVTDEFPALEQVEHFRSLLKNTSKDIQIHQEHSKASNLRNIDKEYKYTISLPFLEEPLHLVLYEEFIDDGCKQFLVELDVDINALDKNQARILLHELMKVMVDDKFYKVKIQEIIEKLLKNEVVSDDDLELIML